MKHIFIIFFILIIFSVFLTSCSQPEMQMGAEVTVEDEMPIQGGIINIGCIEPQSFNPLVVNSKSYRDIYKLFFNCLVEYDSTLKPVLVLAESIKEVEGTDEVQVKLKENMKWSDGEKVTSDDVIYSLDTIKNSENSIYKPKFDYIVSYKAEDEYNIRIRFKGHIYSILDALSFPIIPEHVFAADSNALPIGTGLYKVASYSKLKYMQLELNENSVYRIMPYITRIKINFIKDIESFDTAFQSGQIDLINTSSYDWEKYKESKDVNTHKYLSRDFEFISINFRNDILSDKFVRRALMHGINRTALIEKYLLGNAAIVDTPIRSDSWLFDGDVDKYAYNKVEAQYSVNSAGFVFNEMTKIFEREVDGKIQQLRLTLITNSENDYRTKAAEDIKKNLEDVGFVIDLEILPFDDLKKRMEKGEYDLALVGMNFSPEEDLYEFFHSSQIDGGKNYGAYSNPKVDMLLDQSLENLSTENKYMKYLELQGIIKDELPIISLFYKQYALVTRNKIKGSIQVDSENLFRSINEWYINE